MMTTGQQHSRNQAGKNKKEGISEEHFYIFLQNTLEPDKYLRT